MRKPRTIKDIKNHPAVESFEDERHYDCGYWVYLAEGWHSPDMDCQTLHEYTVKDLCAMLARVVKQVSQEQERRA